MKALLGPAVCLCLLAGTAYPQYVEDVIDVGGAWVGSLAYNSREDVLYGRCQQAGLFFAISCDSNKVISRFHLSRPRQMAYDSLDNRVYCPYEGTETESLAVIDGSTHRLVKSIEMPGATTAVWDPVGDRVYVSCQNAVRVAVVDCRSDSLLTYIDVGWTPLKMYLNTLRRKLYVLNYDAGTVSVINLVTNQVIRTVDVGGTPNSGYYSRRVDKFYCSSPPGSVAVVDGGGDSVVARIPLPNHGQALSMTGNEQATTVVFGVHSDIGNYAYFVSAPNDSVVSVLPVGREPWGTLFSSTTGLVYSANSMSNSVTVMAGDGSRVLKTLPVAVDPFVFQAVPRHGRIYVGHLGSSKVLVIRDSATGVVEPEASGPMATMHVAPNPFSGRLVVTSGRAGTGLEVRVYTGTGCRLRTLTPSAEGAGASVFVWDGLGPDGRPVPPGVYFIEGVTEVRVKVVKTK
jgi:YVTN family beta-propeller protein